MLDIEALAAQLRIDEDVRLKPYVDTKGKITIGVGRNLTDVGISKHDSERWLQEDMAKAMSDLNRNTPWWAGMPEPARRGLCNMCFNMGWPKLSGFKKMLKALHDGDFELAAAEAGDSQWATQVGDRAKRIQNLFRASKPRTNTNLVS